MFVSSKMVWEVHTQSPKWLNSYPTTLHCAWHRSRSIGTMHQALRARGSLAQGVAVANMLLALVKIEKKTNNNYMIHYQKSFDNRFCPMPAWSNICCKHV